MTVAVTGPLGEPVQATIAVRDDVAVIEMAAASGLGVLPTRRRTGRPRVDALAGDEHRHRRADPGRAGRRLPHHRARGRRQRQHRRRCGSAHRPGRPTARRRTVARCEPGGGGLQRAGSRRSSTGSTRAWPTPRSSWPPTSPTRCSATTAPPRSSVRRRAPARIDVEVLDAALSRYADRLAAALGDGARAARRGRGRRRGRRCRLRRPRGARRRDDGRGSTSCWTWSVWTTGWPAPTLVITGEGSLDGQSLGGKTPIGVARRARAHGVPTVLAVCGRTTAQPRSGRRGRFRRGSSP